MEVERGDRRNGLGALQLFHIEMGYTDPAHFALTLQLRHRGPNPRPFPSHCPWASGSGTGRCDRHAQPPQAVLALTTDESAFSTL